MDAAKPRTTLVMERKDNYTTDDSQPSTSRGIPVKRNTEEDELDGDHQEPSSQDGNYNTLNNEYTSLLQFKYICRFDCQSDCSAD